MDKLVDRQEDEVCVAGGRGRAAGHMEVGQVQLDLVGVRRVQVHGQLPARGDCEEHEDRQVHQVRLRWVLLALVQQNEDAEEDLGVEVFSGGEVFEDVLSGSQVQTLTWLMVMNLQRRMQTSWKNGMMLTELGRYV